MVYNLDLSNLLHDFSSRKEATGARKGCLTSVGMHSFDGYRQHLVEHLCPNKLIQKYSSATSCLFISDKEVFGMGFWVKPKSAAINKQYKNKKKAI